MLADLSPAARVVGVKQTRKALREGRALQVFLARDANPAVTRPIAETCAENGVPLDQSQTMAQLGKACGISVGASAAALIK